jgi:hypothetical protein
MLNNSFTFSGHILLSYKAGFELDIQSTSECSYMYLLMPHGPISCMYRKIIHQLACLSVCWKSVSAFYALAFIPLLEGPVYMNLNINR